MIRRTVALATVAFSLSILTATGAMATAQRTFVSSHGNDANTTQNCSLTFPCRSFAPAMTVTNPRGEIVVLDSAGYGPVTITQSVSIIAPQGIYAGVSVASGDGITINAGVTDTVVLRGLTINGQGGANGVVITNALAVHIENCVISNLTGFGINQIAGRLELKDTIVRNNGNIGVFVHGTAVANLDHVRIEINNTGLAAQEGGHVAMHDSFVTGSSNIGIVGNLPSAAIVRVAVTHSQISSNTYGVFVESSNVNDAVVVITESTVSDNNIGIHVSSGGVVSAVRNTIATNGSAGQTGYGIQVVQYGLLFLDGNSMVSEPGHFNLDLYTDATAGIWTRSNNSIFQNGASSSPLQLLPW